VHERYRQMTDRWATTYSKREHEFTLNVVSGIDVIRPTQRMTDSGFCRK